MSHPRLSRRKLLVALGAAFMARAMGSGPASAQIAGKPKIYLFNIPAQPLPSALIAFATVVGQQIMCDSSAAANLRSRELIGLFAADAALRILIAGTDLTVIPTDQDVAVVPLDAIRTRQSLRAPSNEDRTLVLDTLYVSLPPGSETHPDYIGYGQWVRTMIRKTLAGDPRTARRVYSAQLDLWIGTQGAVRETRITRSSGGNAFDAVLRKVLEGMIIDHPPPSGMRQPVHVTVIGV